MSADGIMRFKTLSQTFSPSAPINEQALFAGRLSQLFTVMNSVGQRGQHAILFGERGVGKTSLARVISNLNMMHDNKPVIRAFINCDGSMDFSSLWHKIFREITLFSSKPGVGFTAGPSLSMSSMEAHLPAVVTPDDVRFFLSRLGKSLIVIDELDRLTAPEATAMLADTVKTLSDHAVDATLLLVGVADSVDSLIREHHSIERALAQTRMPRMSPPELGEILERGYKPAEMTIEPDAKGKIVALSQGLPHYTHMLGLYAGQRVASTDRSVVTIEDVRFAIDQALNQAQQSIISSYLKATSSPRENLYPQVLLSCALAQVDSLGYFAAVDVRAPMSAILKRPYEIPAYSQHLNAFCDSDRGPILHRTGTNRRYRFRFENPLMQPYVIMDGIRKGYITDDLRPSVSQAPTTSAA